MFSGHFPGRISTDIVKFFQKRFLPKFAKQHKIDAIGLLMDWTHFKEPFGKGRPPETVFGFDGARLEK